MSGVVAGTGGGTDTDIRHSKWVLHCGFAFNGSIIGLPKAATSAFDPTVAGTYNGVFYEKANVTMGAGSNVETGTPSTGQATDCGDCRGQHYGHRLFGQHDHQCSADSGSQFQLHLMAARVN